ncbi:MAG: protein-glutamate O-methyltransferase CheR [Bdellovibrionaceae bacterium]|nr:protein-glutamate O-methyltransferase CheR [Pseudobdellovibrionaceae bacterium]
MHRGWRKRLSAKADQYLESHVRPESLAGTERNFFLRKVSHVDQHLLLEAVFMKYGFDFRQYAEASLARRLDDIMTKHHFEDPMDLLKRIVQDREFFREILPLFTISTTEFFRDPEFFRLLRKKVIPVLKTYPHTNIWVAGCSTGEEVYSMAILLKEEGLDERSTIYATDINPIVLKKAKEGIFPVETIKQFSKNYTEAGGTHSPSDYYTADYGFARFNPDLRENMVFSEHNLVTDSFFTEAHLILCRNVMIYFNRDLQDNVLRLFSSSLAHRGFLGLGSKESLKFHSAGVDFEPLDEHWRLFQKKNLQLMKAHPHHGGRA